METPCSKWLNIQFHSKYSFLTVRLHVCLATVWKLQAQIYLTYFILWQVLYKDFIPWRWVVLDQNKVRVTPTDDHPLPLPMHALLLLALSEKIRDNFHSLEIVSITVLLYLSKRKKNTSDNRNCFNWKSLWFNNQGSNSGAL